MINKPPQVAFMGSLKQRATRRGLRSLNGRFYHTIQERNAADRAFNKATKHLPGDIHKGNSGGSGDPFDFTYKQDPKQDPKKDPAAALLATPHYHCVNCKQPVDYKTLFCPNCHQRLNWEGL